MEHKKKKIMVLIFSAILIISLTSLIINNKSNAQITTNAVSIGGGGTSQSINQVKIVPLSSEERKKVAETISSSDIIKDIPKTGIVGLVFFNDENGQKIMGDGFLLGRNKILNQGEPDLYIFLNSNYISEFGQKKLCDIIKESYNNGDLKFESKQSAAKLMLKYAGLLKYKGCLG